ncbi:MAG: hypothetical protein IPK72_22535 [Candidatus Eisenbacteria bacterium]|nr:hypothetical protein [Candidatus Eisenbacteria bacterium]
MTAKRLGDRLDERGPDAGDPASPPPSAASLGRGEVFVDAIAEADQPQLLAGAHSPRLRMIDGEGVVEEQHRRPQPRLDEPRAA